MGSHATDSPPKLLGRPPVNMPAPQAQGGAKQPRKPQLNASESRARPALNPKNNRGFPDASRVPALNESPRHSSQEYSQDADSRFKQTSHPASSTTTSTTQVQKRQNTASQKTGPSTARMRDGTMNRRRARSFSHPTTSQCLDHSNDQGVARALEKEAEIWKLRQDLAAATSRSSDLQKSQEALSSTVSALKNEVTTKTSQYKGVVASLTAQVNQLQVTSTEKAEQLADALGRVRGLQLEVSNLSVQSIKSQSPPTTQSQELIFVNKQPKTMKSSNQRKDHGISSLLAERIQVKSVGVAKTGRRSLELNATQSKPRTSISSDEAGDIAVAVDTLADERMMVPHKQVGDLERELFKTGSRITKLQYDTEMQSADLESLRKCLRAAEEGENAYICSLTARVEEWKALCTTKGEELIGARKDLDELRHDREKLSSKFAESQQELTTQIKRLQELDVTRTAELTKACAEAKRLRRELDDSSSRITQLQNELASKTDQWQKLDAAKAAEHQVKLAELNSQVEQCKRSYSAIEEERDAARRKIQQLERDLAASSPPITQLQQQSSTVQRIAVTVDTYADETIVQVLKKLNAEVQQTTTLMAEDIVEQFQRITQATKAQISAASKTIGQTLSKCLASMKHDEAALYLSIAFQTYFSYTLCRRISSWTIEEGHNDFINKLYEQLQNAETQPMSGRWRSLTRTHISPSWTSEPNSLASQIIADLSDVIVVAGCAASTTAAHSKISSFKVQLLSIISTAGKFNEMIDKIVSADFAVTAPPPLQAFEETTMEREDVDDYDNDKGKINGVAAGQKVLCSTQLGMTKRVQRESGKQTLTVVKAKVVLESFLDG